MREIRNKDPEVFRLITTRTVESRLWLVPNSRTRKLFGGILARYQEIFSVEIYAYAFLGNHYHLIIRAPNSNTDEFIENVNREIARRINWIHRKEGPLWSRRYVDQQIITEEDLTECFLYVNTNSAHHGLIKDPYKWPGLSSISQVSHEQDRRFSFRHYTDGKTTHHRLRISALPQFKEMEREARKQHIIKIIDQRISEIIRRRGEQFLSIEEIRSFPPGEKPGSTKKTPKAPFYSKCSQTIKEMRKVLGDLRAFYADASFRYRSGEKDVIFPKFTFFPPLHRRPKLTRFGPIPC